MTERDKAKHRHGLKMVQDLIYNEHGIDKYKYVFCHHGKYTVCIFKPSNSDQPVYFLASPRIGHDSYYAPIGEKVTLLKLRTYLASSHPHLDNIKIKEALEFFNHDVVPFLFLY